MASIGILFFFRRFMLMTKPNKKQHVPNIFGAMRVAQSEEFREAVIKAEQQTAGECAERQEPIADGKQEEEKED